MNVRWVRGGAGAFFLLFVLAVTWPGMLPFNRIRPQLLGLPFSMFWIALWVLGSFLVLLLVDRVESRARREDEEARRGRSEPGKAPGSGLGERDPGRERA